MLISVINNIIPLTEEHKTAIEKAFKRNQLPKGHILQDFGSISLRLYFIEKGLCRIYYINQAGKDITYGFYKEGDFISIAESFFTQSPSEYCIELLEDCDLRSIHFTDLNALLEQYPYFEKVKSHVLQYFLLIATSRIVALQFQSAQERYQTLLDKQPLILQRAPLGHIASYLGITQETLSRIRAKK